jgi:U3 small nucleolar RNA-associated protein 13
VRFLSCGLQLVSSGADGLIKLWTIRTNECETTLDNGHYGKVWALDINSKTSNSNDQPLMVSGGSDSRLVFWKDTTVQEAQVKLQEQEEAILLDQKLANHLRHKEYSQALQIALQRDKPLQVFKILGSIIEADLEKGSNGVDAMQKQVSLWSTEQVVQILRYCREWNTRARNCHVAMVVCKAIVSTIPLATLATMDGGSVPEILAGILVYSERHFERLDRLHTSSYLLDLVLSGMGSLDADDKLISDFAEWEQTSKLVLPPKQIDGRIQIGGSAVVGRLTTAAGDMEDSDHSVVTVGDSSESSSEDESVDS